MFKSNNKELTNWLAYLAVCIFWGSAYVAIKIGVTEIAPVSSSLHSGFPSQAP